MTKISAIVPARNEAVNIVRVVESLATQPEIGEIIVVDDQSTDETPKLLDGLRDRFRQLTIARTEMLPQGWTGKNHAIWTGLEHATGEWLLFTDADTQHLPGSAARALEDAAKHNALLVSYSPEQETVAWWEKALLPFIFCRLSRHFSYARVNDPGKPDAAANGQYLLVDRRVYDATGGHMAVASHIVEDVEIAKRAKIAGYRLHFAPGKGIVRARMYRSVGEMWQGWTKNLYRLVGGVVGREIFLTLPWGPMVLFAMSGISSLFAVLGALLLALRHGAYAIELARNEFPASRVVYYVPAALLYPLLLLSSARRHKNGVVAWKGREYPVDRSGW
ncbi:MAG: glycosyltransferase [Acidobacteria bacterium]|nr:glycosyltransferase [Acidobacteriota bacterium]